MSNDKSSSDTSARQSGASTSEGGHDPGKDARDANRELRRRQKGESTGGSPADEAAGKAIHQTPLPNSKSES